MAGFAVPVTLAIGNVYRTVAWPENTSPDALAFWSHAAAILAFVALLLLVEGCTVFFPGNRSRSGTVASGGCRCDLPAFLPVAASRWPGSLEQIGYVAASVGLVIATFLLDEHYSLATWFGALVIAAGIALTVMAQRRI